MSSTRHGMLPWNCPSCWIRLLANCESCSLKIARHSWRPSLLYCTYRHIQHLVYSFSGLCQSSDWTLRHSMIKRQPLTSVTYWNSPRKRFAANVFVIETILMYTMFKKSTPLIFANNFGKCRPIFKITSPSDSLENFVATYYNSYSPYIKYISTHPVKRENYHCCRFQWHSSGKIWGRLNSSSLNLMTIKSGKRCSSAQRRICDVSELKQWMIDM